MEEITPASEYPPRYEPRPGVPGFTRLVCDEPEWLARPAPWGVEKLSEDVRDRKSHLRYHYAFSRRIRRFIACPACRSLLLEMCAETGYETEPFERLLLSHATRRGENPDRGYKFTPLPGCTCERTNHEHPYRWFRLRALGVISGSELYNWLFMCFSHSWPPTGLDEQEHRRLHAEEKRFDRWLGLELCGPNPFRPVAFDPAWRTEHTTGLALKMYDERGFAAMPILADALEEAGCDNQDILTHCREPGEHVRGCWVVDLVLGK